MRVLYYLILKPLSYLPDSWIHRISDLMAFLVMNLFTYRKKLVIANMSICFPEKSPEEIERLAKLFYRQFSDTMLEILKGFSLTKNEAEKRIRVTNPEVLDELFDKGRDVIITGGHYANWETITLTADKVKHDLYGLFTPISNKFMEKKVTESRSRFGFHMVSTKKYKDRLTEVYTTPRAFVFAVDQSPKKGSGHWMTFLGRDTAVLFGSERTAKKFDMAVVSGRIRPVNRGKYELTYRLIEEHPNSTGHGEITEQCMKDVEEQILEAPEYWLWTHRRWKHDREPADS